MPTIRFFCPLLIITGFIFSQSLAAQTLQLKIAPALEGEYFYNKGTNTGKLILTSAMLDDGLERQITINAHRPPKKMQTAPSRITFTMENKKYYCHLSPQTLMQTRI